MKRNNPETGKPFKQGFVRQDGFVFWGYQKKNAMLPDYVAKCG